MEKQARYPKRSAARQLPINFFTYWPAILAAMTASVVKASYNDCFRHVAGLREEEAPRLKPVWTTPNQIRLELSTMLLRDFSTTGNGVPALVCAPYALHSATIADFAPGHSLVETLRQSGVGHLHVTDWRSATPAMRDFSIDHYFADLNIAVDELGPPVDLIGLCQGGWLALAYAARFPHKVRRLVLAGAPIDFATAESRISNIAKSTPLAVFEQVVRAGGGRVLGQRMLDLWGSSLNVDEERQVLQIPENADPASIQNLLLRFADWYDATVDLPGTYYLQVVSWLFKENRLAEGKFGVLGSRIDLKTVRHPIFLLAGRDDELIASEQLFGTAQHIATAKSEIAMATAPCGHLSLFLGAEILTRYWARIAGWLSDDRQGVKQAA